MSFQRPFPSKTEVKTAASLVKPLELCECKMPPRSRLLLLPWSKRGAGLRIAVPSLSLHLLQSLMVCRGCAVLHWLKSSLRRRFKLAVISVCSVWCWRCRCGARSGFGLRLPCGWASQGRGARHSWSGTALMQAALKKLYRNPCPRWTPSHPSRRQRAHGGVLLTAALAGMLIQSCFPQLDQDGRCRRWIEPSSPGTPTGLNPAPAGPSRQAPLGSQSPRQERNPLRAPLPRPVRAWREAAPVRGGKGQVSSEHHIQRDGQEDAFFLKKKAKKKQ